MAWRSWVLTPDPGPGGNLLRSGPYVELENGDMAPAVCEWLAYVAPLSSSDSPFARMRLEVRAAKPVCTSVTVSSFPDGPEVTAEMLTSIQWGDLIEQVVQAQAVSAASIIKQGGPPQPTWDGSRDSLLSGNEIDVAETRAVRLHRNRKINEAHLREVADVYLHDERGAPTLAVKEHFDTSHRTATRWVDLARKRGFLPPYSRPRKED
ncbi:MAG: hypothetical protein WB565_10035 [Acidimicrobiales bacterium]